MPLLPSTAFTTGVSPNFRSKPRQLRSARKDAEKRKLKCVTVIQDVSKCLLLCIYTLCIKLQSVNVVVHVKKFCNKPVAVWK